LREITNCDNEIHFIFKEYHKNYLHKYSIHIAAKWTKPAKILQQIPYQLAMVIGNLGDCYLNPSATIEMNPPYRRKILKCTTHNN